MGKTSPERREELRRLNEEGRKARAYMQEVIDRIEAGKRAERERAERRRAFWRRVFLLGRTTS